MVEGVLLNDSPVVRFGTNDSSSQLDTGLNSSLVVVALHASYDPKVHVWCPGAAGSEHSDAEQIHWCWRLQSCEQNAGWVGDFVRICKHDQFLHLQDSYSTMKSALHFLEQHSPSTSLYDGSVQSGTGHCNGDLAVEVADTAGVGGPDAFCARDAAERVLFARSKDVPVVEPAVSGARKGSGLEGRRG
jgi:hypothetical protein